MLKPGINDKFGFYGRESGRQNVAKRLNLRVFMSAIILVSNHILHFLRSRRNTDGHHIIIIIILKKKKKNIKSFNVVQISNARR